jgi:hypothetical protein
MAIDVAKLKAAAAGSEQDKVNWYADRIQEGMTDAQIAAAVDKALGTKYSTSGATDPDWNYLQQKAAEQVVKETSKSSVKDKATAYNQLYQGAGLTNDEIQQAIVNAAGKQDPNDIRALLGIAGAQRASALPSGADKATYVKQMLGYGYTPDEIANYINTGVGQQSDADMRALFGLANVNLPTYLQPKADTDTDFKPIEGGAGVAVTGESGLREGYAPYVQDFLQRASALLARRDAIDPKTGEPLFTGPQFGTTYGTDTSKTLSDLQTRRESMMSGDKAYTPFKYSFAPKPAAAGGVMSLVDRYQTGGDVSSGATTGMQGSQVVPSTFTAPTDGYSATTYTSGYTAPTDIYKGPGDAGITAGTATFDTTARDRLMNPYMSGVVDPAAREAKRQSQIQGMTNAAKFAQAGAFGGTRNVLAGAELQRNLATQLGDIYGRGQKEAYDAAQRAFEAEQGRALTAGVETERARQEAGRQGLSGAEAAARFGLDANKLTEQSSQFGAQYGLNVATTAADYEQRARQLQQQAEEAQARGDQFAADLALRQLQEANNAAAATRAFEYQQARDTYLDPFRELSYASSYLTGLPIKAGDTGISPLAESLVGSASGIALLKKALGLPDN